MTLIDGIPILFLQLLSAGLIISGSMFILYRLFQDSTRDHNTGGGIKVGRTGN